jgi:dGTPase
MYFNRQSLEELEDKALAPYGMRSKNSKGRAFLDQEPSYRTVFQRDRDRILHTSAFRRLEYKTQVFINYEGDYFRTRLTHTLEVAQIGRTLARALGANEDLVEAICLAHDLGHSPFGHSGETILQRLMKDHGGFDHNRQSFRIVTELEQRYPAFPGLNLSWEVREGIVKHESEYDVSDASGLDPHLRGNLETQIANVADELAYTTHDLDDGLRSGMITPQMLSCIALWEILVETFKWSGPELDEMQRHQMIRQLVGLLISDMIESTDGRLRQSNVKSVLDIQKLNYNVIGFSDEMIRRNREMKDFLFQNLYRHYRVIRMQVKAENIIKNLFEAYVAEPAMLPTQFQKLIPAKGLQRTVCDYIAGMTDRFAIDEHQRLFDPILKP